MAQRAIRVPSRQSWRTGTAPLGRTFLQWANRRSERHRLHQTFTSVHRLSGPKCDEACETYHATHPILLCVTAVNQSAETTLTWRAYCHIYAYRRGTIACSWLRSTVHRWQKGAKREPLGAHRLTTQEWEANGATAPTPMNPQPASFDDRGSPHPLECTMFSEDSASVAMLSLGIRQALASQRWRDPLMTGRRSSPPRVSTFPKRLQLSIRNVISKCPLRMRLLQHGESNI